MGIERLRLIKGEAESTFATENGAPSPSDIRAVDPVLTTEQLYHDINENRQRITQGIDQVLGRKSAGSRLTFGCYLRGDGVALNSGATATDDILTDLLELCMGGSASDAGSATVQTCSVDHIFVGSGHGSRFSAGSACMVENGGGSGVNQIGLIESISGDVLILKNNLSAAVSAGEDVYNAYTTYIDPSATATWQFQCIGDDNADEWLALGCVGGFTLQDLLQVEAGQLPRVNFDMHVTSWEKDSLTLAAGSYDGGTMLGTTEAMEVHYQDHGTDTRNLISVSQLDINPGIMWTPLNARGNADIEHTDRIRMTQVVPTVSFTVDPAAAYWTEQSARTAKMFAVMFGRTAGQSWCIEVPNMKMDSSPKRAAHAEQVATQVSYRCYEDDAGAANTALLRSPIRIHRL